MTVYILFDVDHVLGVYSNIDSARKERQEWIDEREIGDRWQNQIYISEHVVEEYENRCDFDCTPCREPEL